MSTAYTKQKLKQARDSLAKREWDLASQSAADVLQHEPDNYNANVFLGLALLNLDRFDESQAAYLKATQDQPKQPLAWQGLQKFYTQRRKWDQLRDVLRHLIDLHHDNGDATKCAETYQVLLQLERDEGGKRSLVDALALLLPTSKYYDTLSSLDPPDQTQPEGTTTFDTQMAIHVNSLQVLLEMVDLTEKLEADAVEKETERRRMRLDGARKGKEALRNEVRVEVYSESQLPALYEQILSHPKAPDDLRRETESKLLRRQLQLLRAYPSSAPKLAAPTGTAAINAEKAAEQEERDQQQRLRKQQLRDSVVKMAEGMVIIGLDEEMAWEIVLEWKDTESLADLPFERLRKFISLFPRSARSKSFRALLLLLRDEQFLAEQEELEKLHDVEVDRSRDDDLLGLAIEGLEGSSSSLLGARIAAVLYLLDRDYDSASEVATSALGLARRIENDSSVSLTRAKFGISTTLLTALTHLHPPQHHAKAIRLADSILAYDEANIDALLARSYIDQAASRWSEAKAHLQKVQQLATSGHGTSKHAGALSISPDPGLEAWIEMAWCDVHLGRLEEARSEMEEILTKVDPITFEGVGSEERAKIWWRLGRCLWEMGDEHRHDPAHAFTCFITSLKRNPAFAPSYTSLGIFYETIASPPDAVRASKCFQKAFELDARENEAARRLAEGFADEREWDLVEVVARRTIEGEGGAEALEAGSGSASSSASIAASRRHLSQNAWAWKAIGSVEVSRKSFDKAILAFQIALRSCPDDAGAWQRLGEAYAAAGRHVAALKCFEKCLDLIALEQSQPQQQQQQQRQYEEGEAAAALPLNDGWQARYCIGDVQRQLGNFEMAIGIFEAILQNHADQLGVRIALADTLLMSARKEFHSGYVERSEESVRRAVRQAGRVLLEEDRHLRSAWKIVADATFHLSKFGRVQRADLLLQQPQQTEALQQADVGGGLQALLDLATEMDTDSKLPSIQAVTRRSVDAALASLTPSEDQETVPHADVFLKVSIYLYKLRVVLNANDDDAAGSAWSDLAVSLYRLSRSLVASKGSSAVATAEVGGEKDGEVYRTNLTRQAIGSIKEALRHEPGNEAFWLVLGNLTMDKSLKVAQHAFIRAIESAPKSAIPWTSLGVLYLHHGDVALANEAFIKAQTADPDAAEAWVGQALVAHHHGDERAQRVLFEHAVRLSEGATLEADYGLGESVFHRLGSSSLSSSPLPSGSGAMEADVDLHGPSHALATYLAHRPHDTAALHLSALFCERLGQRSLAMARIETAAALLEEEYERSEDVETARRYAIAETNLGRIRLASGEVEAAREAFEAALGLLDADEGDAEEEEDGDGRERWRLAVCTVHARLGLSLCSHFQGSTEAATAELTELLSTVDGLFALHAGHHAELKDLQVGLHLHLARLYFSADQGGSQERAKDHLLATLEAHPTSLALISTLAAFGIVEHDGDLLEAAISELRGLPASTGSEAGADVPLLLSHTSFLEHDEEGGLTVLRDQVTRSANKVDPLLSLLEKLIELQLRSLSSDRSYDEDRSKEAERVLDSCWQGIRDETSATSAVARSGWEGARGRVARSGAILHALGSVHAKAGGDEAAEEARGTAAGAKELASLALLCAPWERKNWEVAHSLAAL